MARATSSGLSLADEASYGRFCRGMLATGEERSLRAQSSFFGELPVVAFGAPLDLGAILARDKHGGSDSSSLLSSTLPPRLHVQLSPASLECAVVNRGHRDYPIAAPATGASFSVEVTFRTLGGVAVAPTEIRSVAGAGTGGAFAPVAAARCQGGPIPWPARSNRTVAPEEWVRDNGVGNSTGDDGRSSEDGWGTTLLVDLALVEHPPTAGAGPTSGVGTVVARSGYWMSDRAAVMSGNPSAPNTSSRGTSRSRPGVASAFRPLPSSSTGPLSAPSYADLGALRYGITNTSNLNTKIELSEWPVVSANGTFAAVCNEASDTVRVAVMVDLVHTNTTGKSGSNGRIAASDPVAAIWVCLTLLKPSSDNSGDSGDDRLLPTRWSDNCLPALLPGLARRLVATAMVPRASWETTTLAAEALGSSEGSSRPLRVEVRLMASHSCDHTQVNSSFLY